MKIFAAKGIINGDGQLTNSNAVVVKGERIQGTGQLNELIKEYPNAEVCELDGFIYPGFIDCHIHFTGTGVDMLSVDCRKANNFNNLFDLVTKRALELPQGYLVICAFFDPDNYEEKSYPTIEMLDRLFPQNPVFISHIECHGAIINSQFKKLFKGGLEDSLGLIVGENNSRARQFIFDNLQESYKLKGIAMAQKEAINQGVTCIHAMEGGQLFSDKDVNLLIENKDKLDVDLVIYHQTLDVDKVVGNGLKQIGGCVLIDGSSGVYTAALTSPYRLKPDKTGLLYFTKEEIINLIEKAQENNLQVALHCCGDRALDFLMDCFETVNRKQSISPYRHRIEHFEIPRPDQIIRCKELGLVLSMQPSFDYFWGGDKGDYFHTLGERWKWTNPIGTALKSGIIVGAGSDSGVTPISPLLGMHSAVNHHNEEHKVSVSDAIKLFTKNAAYLTFEENIRGDIEKGYWANLTVLSENLLEVDKTKIKEVQVVETIIKGEKCKFDVKRHKMIK